MNFKLQKFKFPDNLLFSVKIFYQDILFLLRIINLIFNKPLP